MITIKAVMFDFGATLIMDDKFDYFGSLGRGIRFWKAKELLHRFEEFKQAYLRVRECLWNDPELRE
jgi:hypothetical protein